MLNQVIKHAAVVLCFTLPAWLIFRILVNSYAKRHGQRFSIKREIKLLVFYVYTVCVLMLTVMPLRAARTGGAKSGHINIMPVVNTTRQFTAVLSRGTKFMMVHSLENIVGNIILFLPLGICLPMLSPGYFSFRRVLFTALFFSMAIELTQLFSRHFGIYRSVDIDDVILNTLGAILGFVTIGRYFLQKEAVGDMGRV